MKSTKTIIAATLLSLAILFAAWMWTRTSDSQNRLIGEWQYVKQPARVITFRQDGTAVTTTTLPQSGKVTTREANYEIIDNTHAKWSVQERTKQLDSIMEYQVSGDDLKLRFYEKYDYDLKRIK